MSQKKVDYYKEQKANRAKIIKKEKRMLFLEKCAGILVLIAAVCWIGFSVYGKLTPEQTVENKQTVLNTTALENYSSLLASEDTEETTEEEDLETIEEEAEDASEEDLDDIEVQESEEVVAEDAEEESEE